MCPGCKTTRCKALHELPNDFSPIYQCPGCKSFYPSKELAVECNNSNEKPRFKPGDILDVDIGYGWFDGEEHWLRLNAGYKFHGKPTHRAYFVVTTVDHNDIHQARYHIRTRGIINGGDGRGLSGWSTATHKTMNIVKKPDPRIVAESKVFIGEVYQHLI